MKNLKENVKQEMMKFLETFRGGFVSNRNYNLWKNQGGHFWGNDWDSFKTDESIQVKKEEIIEYSINQVMSFLEDLDWEVNEIDINEAIDKWWCQTDRNILAIEELKEG